VSEWTLCEKCNTWRHQGVEECQLCETRVEIGRLRNRIEAAADVFDDLGLDATARATRAVLAYTT